LLALCRILFGGFGFRSARPSGFRRRMKQRCENMSPEERERFRERWGFRDSRSESKG
jgi:hypothetical protein